MELATDYFSISVCLLMNGKYTELILTEGGDPSVKATSENLPGSVLCAEYEESTVILHGPVESIRL